MQIIDNRALLLNVQYPERILSTIPRSKQVADNKVLVKWGLDESRVLKNLNIKNVPSPIERQYEWPGHLTPFEHQITTASFLTMHKRAFCFNEQGTGKTASAIWATDYLMKQGEINRVLIICPLSIMDSAWRNDLFKFAMHRTVSVAYGPKAKREKIIDGGAEYVIINYDGVDIVKDTILAGGFDMIIVDEATHYKNAQSKRWKVLSFLMNKQPNTWLWLMTGTPAAQSPLDAYGLAKLVNPSGVPHFYGAFRDQIMYQITRFKWIPKPEATQIVHKALQPAIRFSKEQCMDLPEIVYTKRTVELNRVQKSHYKEFKKHLLSIMDGEEVSAANAAVAMNKLLQISCGAVYSDKGDTVEFDIGNRYKVLMEVIEESSHKVLIFVPFKHVIALLAEKLTKDKITNAVINGDVPPHKRTEIFDQFQNKDDPRVLIIQPQSAAHGVTLTAANTVVWWGPVPSLETYIQANARVHRAGQVNHCTVVQLEGSPVEKRVYGLLDSKIDVHSEIIDLYKEIVA